MKKQYLLKDCRRVLENLWLTRSLSKRQLKVLQKKKPAKESHFIAKLHLTRLLSLFYGGLSAAALKKIIGKATQTKTIFGKAILSFLERRLDMVLYRSHFVTSLAEARQLISHGFVEINGKPVTISSYTLQYGDVFSLNLPSRTFQSFEARAEKANLLPRRSSHLEVNYKVGAGVFLFTPQQVDFPFQMTLTQLAKLAR